MPWLREVAAMSALGLAALAVAQADLAANVRGGQPGRFQSPEVAARLAEVDIDYPAPWCAAEVFHCFALAGGATNLPRTASALRLWEGSLDECRRTMPAPGDVFVVDHGHGRGHCGIVESVSPDGQTVTTIEGDTDAEGSASGDAMGRHTWRPSDGTRGKLLGYLELGA